MVADWIGSNPDWFPAVEPPTSAAGYLEEARRRAALAVEATAQGNTPFVNLFYTKPALDYLVFYQLQEMVNPGYLRRMERNVKRDQGQEFFLPPSQVVGR